MGDILAMGRYTFKQYAPKKDSKGELTESFYKADQKLSYFEINEEHSFNYGLKDGAESIGQISRTNETEDARGKRLYGESDKEKKSKLFRELIEKITSDFYANMMLWSMSDFQTHGKAYRDWLIEKANGAYENGNYDTFKSLTELAEEMYNKEQEIINDLCLTEEEKKLALIELWEEQNPELIEEFTAQYEGTKSETILNQRNSEFEANIRKSESNLIKEITTVIPGFDI